MKHDSLEEQRMDRNSSQATVSPCIHSIIDFDFNVHDFFMLEGFCVMND